MVQVSPTKLPLVAVALVRLSPAGSGSLTVTPVVGSGPSLTRVTVKTTSSPMAAVGSSTALESSRSATCTSTVALSLSLPGSGSLASLAVSVAVLPSVPTASTRALTCSVATPPEAIVPMAQTPVVASNEPCDGAAPRSVRPASRSSSAATESAASGPRLRTVTVNTTVSPTVGVDWLTVLLTCRSAVAPLRTTESSSSSPTMSLPGAESGSGWSTVATWARFSVGPATRL